MLLAVLVSCSFSGDPLRPGGQLLPNVTEEDYELFKKAQSIAQQFIAQVFTHPYLL